jgi:NADPH-dependent 2,4-dienoyl-CoA reductase/sulfur reductase-like enzyme
MTVSLVLPVDFKLHLESVFSVIIAGGGPAGCATALSLHRSNPGISFLLLDDADTTVFKVELSCLNSE